MQLKYYDTNEWKGVNTLGPDQVAISSSAPDGSTGIKLWVDTNNNGIIPASYNVADNCQQTIAGQYVLDAHQGYVLQEQINNLEVELDEIGTVELLKTQTLTTTETTYTLDTGKSFTDYSFILIENMVVGESYSRSSYVVPYIVNGGALIPILHGGSTGTITDWRVSVTKITFVSSTTFKGWLGASGAINQVKIYGVK